MKHFSHILSSITLALCPCINIVVILSVNITLKQRKYFIFSLFILMAEFISFYLCLQNSTFTSFSEIPSSMDKFYWNILLIIFGFASIYSLYFSFHYRKYRIGYLLSGSIFILLCSLIPIGTNIGAIKKILQENKRLDIYNKLLLIALIIIILLYTYEIVISIINIGHITLNILMLYFISSTLNIIVFSIDLLGKTDNKKTNSSQPSRIIIEESIPNSTSIMEKDAVESTDNLNRGWTIDDTLRTEVNLSIIEDIITPITLKNEYEKSTKELIAYIRKLGRHSDADIRNTLGEEGLSGYLKLFFSKIKFDAVRIVYLRSLAILIEDYGKRDSRVKNYQHKITTLIRNRY